MRILAVFYDANLPGVYKQGKDSTRFRRTREVLQSQSRWEDSTSSCDKFYQLGDKLQQQPDPGESLLLFWTIDHRTSSALPELVSHGRRR